MGQAPGVKSDDEAILSDRGFSNGHRARRRSLRRSAASALRRNRMLRQAVLVNRHRGLGEADAFLSSYPKSGNTWIKFMLTDLLVGREEDFDSNGSVVPMLGAHRGAPRVLPGGGRLVKNHEPYARRYDRRQVRGIYVFRDGRDVAVSYYRTLLRTTQFSGSFPDFLALFLAGRLDGYGPWHLHVQSWLESPLVRSGLLQPIKYEDVLDDPLDQLGNIARFLRLDVEAGQLRRAVERNTADRMRERERRSRFRATQPRPDLLAVNSATSGNWTTLFGSEERRSFDAVAGDVLARLGYQAG